LYRGGFSLMHRPFYHHNGDRPTLATNGARHALLIEPDGGYRVAMDACLRLAGCAVETAIDSTQALHALEQHPFDVVVSGIAFHERGAGDLIAEVRLRSQAPIVLVLDDARLVQPSLEAGAERWIPKPFVPSVLIASVRAAIRSAASSTVPSLPHIEIRGMVLDGVTRKVRVGAEELTLTRQEWRLLYILASHPNRYLGAREILRLGWQAGDRGSDQLRTYVHRLRGKVAPLHMPCRLISQHGSGYCLMFD
jgi:two-component system KDP operon response regulator KdpE